MIPIRLVQLTLFSTFLLVTLGGFVHNTGSSLACPDWPLCYGQVFPKMEGGVLIEHSHRLLGSLVGFLTLLNFLFTWRSRYSRKLKWMATLALFFVVIQGILGGITVIYKLPTIVSTSHLGLAMIFFCTLIYLLEAYKGEREKNEFNHRDLMGSWRPSWKQVGLMVMGLLYLQILLGASIRHLGVGAACGIGAKNSVLCFDIQNWGHYWWPISDQAKTHMLHRWLAVFVSLAIAGYSLFVGRGVLRTIPKGSPFRKKLLASLGLINIILVAQISLGIMTVASGIGKYTTTAHLSGAALLLLVFWYHNLQWIRIESLLGNKVPASFLGDLIDLTKPKLSALVLLTASIGLFSAPGSVSFIDGAISVTLTLLLIAGACVLNCFVESEVDAKMQRTQNRPLPDGRIQPTLALIFGLSLVAFSLPALFVWVNTKVGLVGLAAVFFYLCLYTPLKLKSKWAVIVGAFPGAAPILMGWVTVTNSFELGGLLLFAILFVWQIPHFLAISIYCQKDYENAAIKIFPSAIGVYHTKVQIIFYTALLGMVSFLPFVLKIGTRGYGRASLVLSFAFLLFAFFGFKKYSGPEWTHRWAKAYFYGSVIYLPLLLGSFVFFK